MAQLRSHPGLVRLDADKARSIAVHEQARRHHARTQRLVEQAATTEDELERATEALAVSVSDVARAEAAISEGQKALIAADRTLEYHRARLADTRIVAPFDGVIVSRRREAGDVVVPGSSILTLISTEVLWIRAWVDDLMQLAVMVLVISVASSLLGIWKAMRVSPNEALS